jgi:baseplate J-like protein
MTLAITDVFTPAPSGVGPNPPPAGSWMSINLQNAGIIGLSTTSWQPGGVGRTILAITSNMLALEDVNASIMSQGGLLDFAGAGTATFIDPNTNTAITRFVTPDPSNANTWPIAGAAPFAGWLDILADSVYNVQRIQATPASGSITFTNTSGIGSATYPAGQFHIVNVGPSLTGVNGVTYTNANTLTIAASGITTGTFLADVAGSSGNVGATPTPTTWQLVTSLVGVAITAIGTISGGGPFESNAALTFRCRLKVQSISPNGPKGAYQYWALTAFQYLPTIESQIPLPISLQITQAVVAPNPATGVVITTVTNGNFVANGTPIVTGVANLAITGATNAAPIVLTVLSTVGLSTGMAVGVSGVQGNVAANGYRQATVIDGTHLSLQGSDGTASGTYTSGGIIEAGDLGLVDSVIQANAVPLGVTATTVSALAQYVTVQASVYLPASAAGPTLASQINGALIAYFATVPIGGFQAGVPTLGTLPYNEVVGIIQGVSPVIRDVTLTLNGLLVDVPIGATSQPIVVYPGPTQNPLPTGIVFVTF